MDRVLEDASRNSSSSETAQTKLAGELKVAKVGGVSDTAAPRSLFSTKGWCVAKLRLWEGRPRTVVKKTFAGSPREPNESLKSTI
jgi:hypothetical protein